MRVLLIGGTDSSGGAGLSRDIATVTGMGAEASVAVTAVTAQTDAHVRAVEMMPPDLIAEQITSASGVDAVKIGMLGSAPIIAAVARTLPDAPLVLDPVLASTSGRALLDEAGIQRLLTELLPRTAVLTPNLPELCILSRKMGLKEAHDEASCVAALLARGCEAVLVKGGHSEPASLCEDRLYLGDGTIQCFRGPRYSFSLRGTGCQLASAIAVALGRGDDHGTAVSTARDLVDARFQAVP